MDSPKGLPFLKWAGGKQWFAPACRGLLADCYARRYVEPFVGGGSVFFSLAPNTATISDYNVDLICTYETVKTDVEEVITELRNLAYDKELYYRVRSQHPRLPARCAARFIYLNRCCWNGLYRVNQNGQFNVPLGRYKNPTICDGARLRACAHLLRTSEIRHGDFAACIETAGEGDLVYMDPPYVTGHTNNGFLKYNAHLFKWEDQERLARAAIAAKARGAVVIVSNADHAPVVRLYTGFHYYRISRNNLIGGCGSKRERVHEALLASRALGNVPTEVI